MTLEDLRIFVAACEAGSLSHVARDLSRTQSAVSQHVKGLESEFGVPLLERQPRGVAVTEAGQILYQAATSALSHIDGALRQVTHLRNGEAGSIRIATGATTVRHFMSAAIIEFRRRHPKVHLEFRTENSSRACLAALAAGDADLAWISMGAQVRGIEQRPVIELPWVLATHVHDQLASKHHIDLSDLASLRQIRLPQDSVSRGQLEGQLAPIGTDPISTAGVADWDTAMLLAELGLGHAIVPRLPEPAAPGPSHLRLIPIPDLAPIATGWAARQWEALSPVSQDFADTVAATLRDRRADPAPGLQSAVSNHHAEKPGHRPAQV